MYLLIPSYHFPRVSSLTPTPSTYPPPRKGQVSRVDGISDDGDGSDLTLSETEVANTSSRRRTEGRKPQNKKQEGGERKERVVGVAVRKTELETHSGAAEAFVLCDSP